MEKILIKANDFFSRDFPFYIARFHHPADEFDSVYLREFWKIIYVLRGEGRKLINGREYPVKPGSLYVIHPEDVTTFMIDTPFLEVYNILFLPSIIAFGLREMNNDFNFFSIFQPHLDRTLPGADREQLYVLDSSQEIGAQIRKLEQEYRKKPLNYQFVIRLQLLELLAMIVRLSARKIRKNQHHGIVKYIDTIIAVHFGKEFDYDRIAAEIGISKSYLCRVYRRDAGCTIGEKLLQRRLQAAQEQLIVARQKNISEICYGCGFNDLAYFYRAFASRYGMNPGDFRKKFRLD